MNKNFIGKFLIATTFCLLLGIIQVFAQSQASTGQITGVITDPNGSVVPSTTVTITNKGNNATQTATTTDEGIYRFVLLQPGNYTVKANASGFAEQTLDVEVQVGRTTDANFTLGAASATAQVEVTAEGVQTTQSNNDAVLNETAIQNLPINGRRFQDFITLTPGAQVGQGNDTRGQVSLSGQRGINSNINVDGVDYNQPFFGGIRGGERSNLAFTIPQESIKEFQVVAAGYSAEFGRSTGGIVNAVTKSGDNNLRGSLFYLWRPEQLARGNKFTDALQEQRLAAAGVNATLAPTQHQFGGSIGGPIVKDKLFYFASYEQQKFRAPRQIIFTNFPPTGTLNAGQQAVASFYAAEQQAYELTNDAFAALGRIDWNITANNRFNVRYNFSKNNAANAVSRGETSVDPTTTQSLSTNGIEGDRNNIGVAQLITNFGSSTVNELRFQAAREDRPRESNSALPQILTGFATYGATNFLPTTQYDTRYQVTDALTYLAGNHTFKFGGEYSRLFASQLFGFGQFGEYQMSIGSSNTNILDTLTRLANVPTTISTTQTVLGRFDDNRARYLKQIGNREAAFKVQELAFFAQDSWRVTPNLTLNYGLRAEQQYNPEPEANNTAVLTAVENTIFPIRGKGYDPTQIPDSGWQWGPRFGFAYDPKGDGKTVIRGFSGIYYARTPLLVFASSVNNFRNPPGDVRTTLPFVGFSQTTFDTFLGTPGGAPYVAITGCNLAAAPNTDARNRCTPNTVFRQFAILGINLNNSPLNNLPILSTDNISGIASALGLTPNPFVGAQVTGHAEDFKNPRSLQFGIGFEREIATNWVIGLDYSQVKTTRLQRNRDINLPAPLSAEQYISFLQANNTTANFNTMVSTGIIDQIRLSGRSYIAVNTPAGFVSPTTGATIQFPTGAVTTRQRPTQAQGFLALGSVQLRESTAKSFYQALTFRTRLVRKWGQLNAYYTLSKSVSDDDNERDSGGVGFADPYNLTGEYYLSRLDRRHQFTANPVFFLPWDIEVSSAVRLRSGTPINTTVGADLNGDTVNNDRPLLVPGLTFKRNEFRNRNIYDVDLRIQKSIKFDERRKLVFTSEFFNVFNFANLQFPTPNTATSAGFIAQYCATASQLCGLNGVTNINFLQIRDQNPSSANFGKIAVGNNVTTGSPVFQVQLGARFMF
jgi:outer membrane receptor for ferrienterochelin and colicin